MELTPSQKLIVNDRHRFRVVNCGRRFGKTTLATLEMVGKAVYKKGTRVCYIAPTYQQARDIAWQMLVSITKPIASKINETRLEITLFTTDKGTSEIVLRGWESVETLRGQKFDFLVIDEIASMRNWWGSWSEVLRPTLTDTKGEALFISTPKGFNHWYELYGQEAKDLDYKSFHFSSFDNPFLPREELEKARKELTEDRFAQEYLADFRKTEGLVYKEFDRKKHLYTDMPPVAIIETLAGVDFGTSNPCAELTIKRDYDNHFWVTKEWYERGKTETEICEHVAAQKFNKVYPDPESASGVLELRKKGVNVRDVIKGKDSIKAGINKVRELFKANRLHIHTSCTNLVWELETYSYADKKELRNEDENPIKENDHAVDALRYVLMMVTEAVQKMEQRQTINTPLYGQRFTKFLKV